MSSDTRKWQFELIVCQIAKNEFHFSNAMREAICHRLQDFDRPPNKATLILASDLISTPHIQKPNKTSVLARDVLIVVCLALLQELGYKLTRGETTQADGISASQYVFEYLVSKDLTFADSARTIEQIWTRRHDKWRKIGFDECPFDKDD
jgi:hypothetical protein